MKDLMCSRLFHSIPISERQNLIKQWWYISAIEQKRVIAFKCFAYGVLVYACYINRHLLPFSMKHNVSKHSTRHPKMSLFFFIPRLIMTIIIVMMIIIVVIMYLLLVARCNRVVANYLFYLLV